MNEKQLSQILAEVKPKFDVQNVYGAVEYAQQCLFAKQQLTKNDYSMSIAGRNQESVKSAILNVAAIGISLNPAQGHAYLVPRDNQICLDISYKGLVKLATDCGAIMWAKAVLVYERDDFQWNGSGKEPDHKADVFAEDRGQLVGGYCIAKLPDGSVMTDTMTAKELAQVQATSKAKSGPWQQWPDEMRKKTLVKRASKSWPQSNGKARIDEAIEVLNSHEGIEEPAQHYTKEELEEYQRCVNEEDFFNLAGLIHSLSYEAQTALNKLCFPQGEKGQKMKQGEKNKANMQEGKMQLESATHNVIELIEGGDDGGAYEILADCSKWTFQHINSKLAPAQQVAVDEIMKAA